MSFQISLSCLRASKNKKRTQKAQKTQKTQKNAKDIFKYRKYILASLAFIGCISKKFCKNWGKKHYQSWPSQNKFGTKISLKQVPLCITALKYTILLCIKTLNSIK
ncbi:MAG: hypothetical protein DRR16_01535 [Candidatus Parabeggiatoa sp. nov. 3]|nr:MAG: hypothetical protein DRR16_01535 [Gammaproteobacteria bacterium]